MSFLLLSSDGAWTPARLSPFVWLDPSDLSTLRQNSDGTTAVAIGDPVGFVADKSGNGNNAVQATSGARPLLQRDATGYYLDFDGTDDCLQIASCTLPTFIYLVLGAQQTNAKQLLIEHSANAGNNDGFEFFGTSGSSWALRRSSVHSASGVGVWPGTVPMVGELYYDGAGTFWKNGVAQANNTITGTARSNSNVTTALNIFSRNQASAFTQGGLYGLIIAPYTASTQQPKARTYMGKKAGITL